MTHRKNNLYPAWQDSSYLLWLQSLQFSSSDLCCFIPDIYFMLDHGKCSQCKYRINSFWLHICTKKPQARLTIFQSWPLEWCCLLSEWNWFPCTVPFQTAPAVWPLQTISPWTIRAKNAQTLKWAFMKPPVEGMNKSAYFSAFNKMCSRCPA